MEGAVEQFGGLDVLVNNAGVRGEPEPVEETTLASWERSIAIMQTGVFLGLKWAAPALLGSGHASVVNISSIFGASGGFGSSPAYHAAKGAVRALTKNAALRWARRGVRVNSVHPGFIDTPLLLPEAGRGGPRPASSARRCWTSLRWDGSGGPRRSRPASPTSPATTPRSSPARSFTSTAATWRAELLGTTLSTPG